MLPRNEALSCRAAVWMERRSVNTRGVLCRLDYLEARSNLLRSARPIRAAKDPTSCTQASSVPLPCTSPPRQIGRAGRPSPDPGILFNPPRMFLVRVQMCCLASTTPSQRSLSVHHTSPFLPSNSPAQVRQYNSQYACRCSVLVRFNPTAS